MPTKDIQSEIQRIPKLRFPGFSGGWKEKKLKDLSINGFSNGVFNDPSKVGSGYKLINVKDMYLGEEIQLQNLTLVELDKNEFIKNKALQGDIFFTRSSLVKEGIAYSNILTSDEKDVTFDGHIIRMRPNTEIVFPKFLARSLKTHQVRRMIVARGKTGTMTTIGQDDLATVKVFIPLIPEQQKIADFLGSTDELINNLKEQKENLESYKKGMMQKIFSQEIRFKDEKGKDFPKWKNQKLGQIFYAEKGDGLPKSEVVENGPNDCILYGELYTTYKEVVFKVESKTNSKEGLLSQVGDLLIPCSTTTTGIDLANVTALNKERVLLGGDITVLRSKEKINNIFYAYYLSNYKKRDIAKYAQGSTIVHLYYNHFKKMMIDLSIYEEQEKIANFLTSIDKLLESKQNQITEAEQWKKGLMQGLFV